MKLSSSDLLPMRWSLLSVCASVLLSSAMLYGSSRYEARVQQEHLSAQSLMNDARSRLAAARQDQQNMSVYSAEYGALEQRKIIGDEQRLDWLEGLDKLRSRNLVSDFRYTIAPQKNHVTTAASGNGDFDIHYSEMKLQFDLLHEAQLLDFFAALHNQISGRYQLEGCTLQRVAGPLPDSAQIKAECTGGWITLKNRDSTQ
ncbi:MAG: hypothetical protein WC825_11870 [Gallionellaceae bacterium]|jgi:hypothetical protein